MPLRSPAGPPPVVVGGCIESPAGDERLLVAARPFNSNEQLDDAQSILHALGSKSRHGEDIQEFESLEAMFKNWEK